MLSQQVIPSGLKGPPTIALWSRPHTWNRRLQLHSRFQQEAVLKATAVRSPLPVMSSILPCPPCLPQVMLSTGWGGSRGRGVQGWGVWARGEGLGRGRGVEGGGGRGHFVHLAIYCITTWCFVLRDFEQLIFLIHHSK